MKKWIKKYGFILIILSVILICCIKKESSLETSIVSVADSQIFLSTNDILEQTWQPHVKIITGVKIPYIAEESFKAKAKLKILTDDKAKVLLEKQVEENFIKEEKDVIEFTFEETKLILGDRYRIQLSFEETEEIFGIFVDSGINYMGAKVNDIECNEGAALKLTYVKNSRIFWLFSIMFPLFSFSFLFMVLWNRKWEEVISLSFIISIVPMYIMGLVEHLLWGITLLYILATISFFFSMYVYIRKEYDWKDFISPGLLLWVVGVIVILFSCQGIWLARWDEYSHWGLAVKDMFYYDSFAKHYNTTVMLPRYLPFATLVEYLYVYLNGIFAEDIIYVAFQIMLLSGLIITAHIANDKWKYIFPIMIVIIFVPVIFFHDVSSCIYVDPLLAVFGAYVLICYFGEQSSFFNWFRIWGGLFALVTIKDMGFVLAGLLTMIIIADTLYTQWNRKKFRWKELFLPGFSSIFVIAVFVSWQVYLSIPYATPHEAHTVNDNKVIDTIKSSGVTVQGIIDFFTKKGKSYQYFSVRNFIVKLFDADAYTIGNIGVSCMDIAIVILASTIILGYLGVWKNWKNKMVSFGCLSFLGLWGYCGVLALLYIFAFTETEAISAASYERYVGSFLCAQVLVFFYLLLRRLSEDTGNHKKCYSIAISLAVLIIIWLPVKNIIFTNREQSISESMKYGFSNMEEVLRSFSKRGETVYFICSNSNGGSYFMFRNSASPLQVPYRQVNIVSTKESMMLQEEIYDSQEIKMIEKILMTEEEWEKKLENCHYVFIMNSDEMFRQDYAGLFVDEEEIENGAFYRVIKKDNSIKLDYVGSVGVKDYY